MGDYFKHWLDTGNNADPEKLPKIFYVNWFRKDEHGKFLWPGFGDNIRVLKWIFERLDNADGAVETPIGYLPDTGALDISGMNISNEALDKLLCVNKKEWLAEAEEIEQYYKTFGERLPGRTYRRSECPEKTDGWING